MDVIERMAEHIGHRVSLIGGEDATDGLICETCGEYLIEWDDIGSTADVALREAATGAMAEADQLRGTLERIRRDEGKVCAGFTECEHRACQSSYTAWAIADEALQRSITGGHDDQ